MAGLPGSGFPEATEFERRLRILEAELATKAPANSEIDPSTAIMIGQGVPQVNGLVVTKAPLENVLTWNAVPITDLKRYEIQWSLTSSFDAIIDTKFTRETTWIHNTPTAEVLHYYRVRARNTIEATGAWSAVQTNTPGQNATDNILDSAATTAKFAGAAITTTQLSPEILFNFDGSSSTSFGYTHNDLQQKKSETVTVATDTKAVIIFATWALRIDTASRRQLYELRRGATVLLEDVVEPQHASVHKAIVTSYYDELASPGEVTYSLWMGGKFGSAGPQTLSSNVLFLVIPVKANT